MNRKTIIHSLQVATLASIVTLTWGCHPTGPADSGGGRGGGPTSIAKVKYTCSNGSVETTDAACGDRAKCEDLCQHSGGSGGSCADTPYFCSVAQP